VISRWYIARLTARIAKVLTSTQSNPTQIFAEDVTEEKGENARLSAFVGAIAVGDLVKSTLGPKGMDKILQSA
jgi:T-complex protein 1 subunit beta